MTRAPAIVLVLVALAGPGCGLAGVPGPDARLGRSMPAPPGDFDVAQPRLAAPVISDEAMDRAVQAGLARSDDDTRRMLERCLTPGR